MSDARTELEILIKTFADTQGITLTNDKLQETVQRVEQLQQASEKSGASQSRVTDVMKEQAAEAVRLNGFNTETAKGLRGLGDAAEGAGHGMSGMGRAGLGLKEVIGGIEFHRPAEAIRGIINLTGAAGIGFGALAAAIAVATAAAAPLIAAIVAMRAAHEQNLKDLAKYYSDAAKGSEDYKVRLDAVTTAAKSNLEAQIAEVNKLRDAYAEVVGAIDKAEARTKATNAARKELELAKAKTPEERAAVEEKYSGIDAENKILGAGVREKAAQAAIVSDRRLADEANSAVDAAKQKAAAALTATRAFAPDDKSPAAIAARNEARAAQDAVKAAQANAAEAGAKSAATERTANDQLDVAAQDRELGGLQEQTNAAKKANAPAVKIVAVTPGRQPNAERDRLLTGFNEQESSLQAKISAQEDANFRSTTLGAGTDELASLKDQLAKTQASRDQLLAAVTASAQEERRANDAAKKEQEKLKQQAKNQRAAAPSGG